jgi:hypothetical protein
MPRRDDAEAAATAALASHVLAQVSLAEAALSEGFCPKCHGRLRPTELHWLYCPPCDLSWLVTREGTLLQAVGEYPPPPP